MKWLTFATDNSVRHGYVDGEEIVVTGDGDLSEVVAGTATESPITRVPLAGARILAPLLKPGKIIAAAANYQSHVTESGAQERDERIATPRLFLKPDSSLIGHEAPVELDPMTRELDWEVELAVVIGAVARRVSEADALKYVFGYATSNDISARSLELGEERDDAAQSAFFDWLEGKWLDGSAPIGPFLVSADEVADPQDLALTLLVNGEVKQSGNTSEMIHDVAELVSFSSRLMTLNPGDIILTGTPAGVGATTGEYLAPGDVMVAEVAGLGELHTPVILPAQID
ncbi:fumarylacetoacetate hydrolase family protein [Leucobacter sp. UT-8R-CII-1-4]|uniref:fumarylacetoacetate hydrolase family protein n=1 Tax=Leucobacter sp. UT-8R-CII-1-4 TaxID=3040075 RepID=UPI0024A9F9F4|nr:fumarylacetoacetate hydrolase family protein [Leucobacter sp. UT-8R-CII-1-4]MDI6023413.1 fumarylacetoacetate hydrolase family protein [Leucobacter sp. UT-8R-CII-1-4]